MKYLWIFICLFILVGLSFYFYSNAVTQSTYVGLPTVACIDATQSIKQNFFLTITIYINNKKYLLDPTIGHDYGNCLHTIFTNDSSGTVYVKANDTNPLTLGQFFDVWHRAFSKNQIFQYQTGGNHTISVIIDGKRVDAGREIVLQPNEKIIITYR